MLLLKNLYGKVYGQTNATFTNATTQSEYEAFKTEIRNKINNMQTKPSFSESSVTIDAGSSKVLTDTNGVFANYKSLDVTTDGVRLQHNQGENTLTITVDPTCTKENVKITDAMIKSWGCIKDGTQDYDTTLFIDFPSGVQDQIYSLNYNDPVTLSLNLKVNIYGNLEIGKKDNKGNYIPNTSFKLSYNSDMSNPIGTFTTGSNGKVLVEQLKPGTVYVQETKVPDHLILDSSIKPVTIKTSDTVSFTNTNNWKQGYIQVTKKDAETGKIVQKQGTIFDIYNSSNKKIASITTNSNGIAKSNLLDYGTYYIKESTAPDKYTLKVEVSDNIGVVENGKTYQVVISNTRVKGSVTISKEDTHTGKNAQGEATLENATYGLYARTPICDPADGNMIYNTDVLVGTMKTNSEANATLNNLYLGEYYIKEISPSNGYTLDTNIYNFDLTYQNQNVKIVTKDITVKERVISQAFEIIKISSDEAGEAELLSSAEFTIKAQKDIEQYGSWENAPIAKNAYGKTAAILRTDENGYAVSDRLPFGKYVVRETKVPDDKMKTDDFVVTISEDSDKPQVWRVFNDTSFTSVLSIIKKDSETGKIVRVSGAKFRIKNIDTNEYYGYWDWSPLPHYVSEWTTDETGTVMTGDKLSVGNYQLEEIKSPNGYLISNTPVKFRISSNTAFETLPDNKTPVITITQTDKSVKGKINIEKRGEVLVGYSDNNFKYEERGLANAKFEIIAKEDIKDPSNDGTIIYKKGNIVQTITTGENGKATSKELPLGEYSVKEITAPIGFVINSNIVNVSLKYKDQNTSIVYDNATFVNDRQKVDLKVVKSDFDDGNTLGGAEFGIYAKTDILNYKNEIIFKAGDLIESTKSNDKGNVKFKADLPLYEYQIKEIKAPIGYSSSNEIIDVNASYKGQETKIIDLNYEFKNKIIKVEISKQDITNSEEIEGAHLTVYDKENPGEIFDTWISTKEPHIIKGLEVGKTYILKETSAPYGFALTEEIEFTIKDTSEIQKVEMKDELVYGVLEFNKYGEIFNQTVIGQNEFGITESPIWTKSNLLDTKISIYANEDIKIGNTLYYEKDQLVETLESDWETVSSKKLPVGSYYYIESKVPFGYIQDTNKHYFKIEDNQKAELQIIKSSLFNNRAKFNIDMTKVLEEQEYFVNENAYKDILFGIYAREDIYDYMGNVAIKNGTFIDASGIDEKGNLINIPDLPIGVYYIKELATNEQYILNDNEFDFEVFYPGKNIAEYTIKIGNDGIIDNKLARGEIKVQKIDLFNSDLKLKDIEFDLSTKVDMSDIVLTAKTDENGIAYFSNLELGTYYIQEKEQIDGYILNNTIYEVEISNNGDVLTINCENKPLEMFFSKVDETGVNELPGAKIQIIDKETNEIVEEWISSDEPHIVRYLVEGKEYIMKEITAPNGYLIAEEITFKAGDNEKITMKNNLIPDTPKTGDDFSILFYIVTIIISLSVLIFIFIKNKKNRNN